MEEIHVILLNSTKKNNVTSDATSAEMNWTNVFSVFLLILPCSILGGFLNIKASIFLLNCKKARKKYAILIKMVICCALLCCIQGPMEILIFVLELFQIPLKVICTVNLFAFTTINFCINTCTMVTAWERYKHINNTNRTLKSNRVKLILASFSWVIVIPVLLAQTVGDMLNSQTTSLYLKVCSLSDSSNTFFTDFSSQAFIVFFLCVAKLLLLFTTAGIYLWSVIVVKAKLQKVAPINTSKNGAPKPKFKLGLMKRTSNAQHNNEENMSPKPRKKMIPRKNTWESLVRKYSKMTLENESLHNNKSANDPNSFNDEDTRKTSIQKLSIRPKVSVVSLNRSIKKKSNIYKISSKRKVSETSLSKNKYTPSSNAHSNQDFESDAKNPEPVCQVHTSTENVKRQNIRRISKKVSHSSNESLNRHGKTYFEDVNSFQSLSIEKKYSNEQITECLQQDIKAPTISDALLRVSLVPVTLYAVSPRNTISCPCDHEHDDPFPPLRATSGYRSRLNSSNDNDLPREKSLSVSSRTNNDSLDGSRTKKSKKKEKKMSKNLASKGRHTHCHMRDMTLGNTLYSWRHINYDVASPSCTHSQFSFDDGSEACDVFDLAPSGSSKNTSSTRSQVTEESRQIDRNLARLNSCSDSLGYAGSNKDLKPCVSDANIHSYSIPGMPTSMAFYLMCEKVHFHSQTPCKAAMCFRNINELQCMQNLMPVQKQMRKVRSLEDFDKFSRDLTPPEYQKEADSSIMICEKCQNIMDNQQKRPRGDQKFPKKRDEKKVRSVYTQTDLLDAAFEQLQEETQGCPAIKLTRPSLPEEKQCDCKNKENKNLQKLFYQLISKSPKIKQKLGSTVKCDEQDTMSNSNSIRSGTTIRSNSCNDNHRLFNPSPQRVVMFRSLLLVLSMAINIVPCFVLEMYNLFSSQLPNNMVAMYPIFHGLQCVHVITNSILYVYANVRLMQVIKEE